LAGGGGANLLLVVNPSDEQQLRIAAEYQRLRHVPDCNVVFVEPRTNAGFFLASEPAAATGFNYVDTYLKPVADHIAAKGLFGQIDYIAVLGQPFRLTGVTDGAAQVISHGYALTYLDALVNGATPGAVSYTNFPRSEVTDSYTEGANEALLHSSDGLYVGTTLAFTGIFGNSPADVISNLQRTVAADGTRPAGTVYFEENNDVRSNTREYEWPATQTGLTARGIPYIQESNISGSTPLNRADVRGAVIGAATYTIPNGSTYLPGSWADSLTSFGCNFDLRDQTKASELIRAGAGGSGGTVTEPYANSYRFPQSHIFLYLADGSTLGEAFYKSIYTPLIQLMLGDPLGQPYADVPTVTIDSGPIENATVGGAVSVSAHATLSSPNLATGIARMDFYIDGKLADTANGSNATFNVDTTTLSDGSHEWRIVAVNNVAAGSQGHLLRNVRVNNDGRSVSAAGTNVAAGAASVTVPVSSTAGSGSVTGIELRCLSRVVGQISGGSGTANLDATKLAYGINPVIPVALFSDGDEVAGTPVTVTRSPAYFPGSTPSVSINRQYGILGEYFNGQGGASISNSTFLGTPDVTVNHTKLFVGVCDSTNYYMTQLAAGSGQLADVNPNPVGSVTDTALVDHLSARYTGRFEVPADGEYSFFFYKSNDSLQLSIDGQIVMAGDGQSAGFTTYYSPSVFLAAGEHTLQLLAANTNTGRNDGFFDVALYVRAPGGLTRPVDDTFLYQVIDRPAPHVVGYWRHDEETAADAGVASVISNAENPGVLDGIGVNAPLFSKNTPGAVIRNPLTGTRRLNRFSLDASSETSRIRIPNRSELDVSTEGDLSFTLECFIHLRAEPSSYTSYISRLYSGPEPDSVSSSDRHAWFLGFNHDANSSFGKIRSRWDLPGIPPPDFNLYASGGYIYADTNTGSGDPADYALSDPALEGDGLNDRHEWHHIAMVYDDLNRSISIYTDYQRQNAFSLSGIYSHPPADLLYGFGILVDEVRYTQGVLDASLFLRAEPLSGIDQWRLTYFGDISEEGPAWALADPDQDGIANLMEYAFGFSPVDVSELPGAELAGGSAVWAFSSPVDDVVFKVMFSTNLLVGIWSPVADEGGAPGEHLFQKQVPDGVPLFFRLFVESQ
jgi:hypothetical protein